MTSQKCESRHLACHQEPFAPTFRNHTCSSPTVAIWWPFPPTFQGLSGSGNCGRGQGAVHEEMESPRDHGRGSKHEALPNSGQSCLIPRPARWHGHSPGQGIYTLFKRKSLFKPKSQEASSPECQSRLVAPHQEPFAPMFENHTGSSRTVASSWLLPGLGGRGPGSLV